MDVFTACHGDKYLNHIPAQMWSSNEVSRYHVRPSQEAKFSRSRSPSLWLFSG